jgi:hypothetical protein
VSEKSVTSSEQQESILQEEDEDEEIEDAVEIQSQYIFEHDFA